MPPLCVPMTHFPTFWMHPDRYSSTRYDCGRHTRPVGLYETSYTRLSMAQRRLAYDGQDTEFGSELCAVGICTRWNHMGCTSFIVDELDPPGGKSLRGCRMYLLHLREHALRCLALRTSPPAATVMPFLGKCRSDGFLLLSRIDEYQTSLFHWI